jgi:uncharacterized protein YcgI (DUF1989 family)
MEAAADGIQAAEIQAHQEDLEETVEDGIPMAAAQAHQVDLQEDLVVVVVDGTQVVEVQVHQVDHHLRLVQDYMTLTPEEANICMQT